MKSSTEQEMEATSVAKTSVLKPTSEQHIVLPQLNARDFDRVGKTGSNISIAVGALWSNRLRSMLTALGIFIGVAAVVTALILTQGVSASITNSINSLGTNLITISPGSSTQRGFNSSGGATLSLTAADATAVTKVADVTLVSPVISVQQRVIFNGLDWSTRIQGVNTDYQTIENWTIIEGQWFSTNDGLGAKPVAVIGQAVVNNLFKASNVDPIGQSIRIGTQPYRVVGVLDAKAAAATGSQDDVIYVPFLTAQNRLKNTAFIDQILVQVDDSSAITSTQRDITTLLQQRHHIVKGNPDDFSMTNSTQLLQTASQFTSVLTALLVGIAAISLTVGGVGIMNIMIVSVTERTREIGIRMSIGAQRQDIRNQFLIEALILSVLGGVIGMALGLLIGFGVTTLVGLPFVITVTSLVMPFVISAAIGVVFGFYPAARAARLDPIEALRSL